jgi:hypothetical protein
MAITLHIESVITAIAALSVSGVTVCDLGDIPESPAPRTTYLIPSPSEPSFVAEFEITRQSFGMSTAATDATYTLNYKYLYAPAGSERGLSKIYPGMVGKAVDIIEAILSLTGLNGSVTWKPKLGEFFIISDPAGISWHGCLITIEIQEFMQ